jgi:phytoene dehydrogenase-like protein
MEYMRAFSHFLFPCGGKLNSSTLLYLLHHLFSPFYLFREGSSSLPQFLVDIIRKNDGEVNCGVHVNGLIKDGGRISGVEATLESVQEQITAGAVIINSFAGMRDDGHTSQWKQTGAASKGTPQVLPFSLLLGVEEAALPEPLGPLALAQLNEAIPQIAGGVVRVSLSPPRAEDWAPENERTLKATLFLKREEERDLDSRDLAALTQLTLESLTAVIPFLRSHITFMRVFTPDDYMRLCSLEHGALAAGSYRPGLQGKRQAAIISPTEGLYLVGASSIGEFGTLAAVRSGLRTAEALSG